MRHIFKRNRGQKTVHYWNHLEPLERLNFVMEHNNLFWSLGLITEGEINVVKQLSEASKEYIIQREEQPVFTSLHLKKDVKDQFHAQKLKTLLRAVFLTPSLKKKYVVMQPINA